MPMTLLETRSRIRENFMNSPDNVQGKVQTGKGVFTHKAAFTGENNLIGSSYYQDNLYTNTYENSFQFISMADHYDEKHRQAQEAAELKQELTENATINFDEDTELFEFEESEESD